LLHPTMISRSGGGRPGGFANVAGGGDRAAGPEAILTAWVHILSVG
jgi:hypothetical protein